MPRGHSGQVADESGVLRLVETFSPYMLICVCFQQRDGVCVVENGSMLSAGREFEWAEQRRIQMVSVLRGFRGTKHTNAAQQLNYTLNTKFKE